MTKKKEIKWYFLSFFFPFNASSHWPASVVVHKNWQISQSLTSISSPLVVAYTRVAYLLTFQRLDNCNASNLTKSDLGQRWAVCQTGIKSNACAHESPPKSRARERAIEHPIQSSLFQRIAPPRNHPMHCKPGREVIHNLSRDFSILVTMFPQIDTKFRLTLCRL